MCRHCWRCTTSTRSWWRLPSKGTAGSFRHSTRYRNTPALDSCTWSYYYLTPSLPPSFHPSLLPSIPLSPPFIPLSLTHFSQACSRFVNSNAVTEGARSSTRSPELLARFCDSLLRKRYMYSVYIYIYIYRCTCWAQPAELPR